MIFKTILVALLASILGKAEANFTIDCENSRCKAAGSLDVAIELLSTVRDNLPSCSPKCRSIDCEDVLRKGQNISGIYWVWPRSRAIKGPLEVYCDMDTDGGGWTVIQRRGNYMRPKDFFYQNWIPYKEGFGNIDKDFWLGNDNIFGLSNQRSYSVRFDLKDVEGNQAYALYDTFWIDDEEHKYTLHIGGFSGSAGDSMIEIHNGQKFSARNQDNDNEPEMSCSGKYKGGWWYNRCHSSNLNGLYLRGKHDSYADGVNWSTWKGHHESLDWTEIKIRRGNFHV